MSKNNLASLPPFVVNSEQTDGAFSMTEYLSKPGNTNLRHTCTVAKMSSSMYWKAAGIPTRAKRDV
jgi:hypothetical protein